ncbi:hypothetical protein BaRGS_00025161, partial [Batillaria attramentaria]
MPARSINSSQSACSECVCVLVRPKYPPPKNLSTFCAVTSVHTITLVATITVF